MSDTANVPAGESPGTQRVCRHKGNRGECLAPDCNCPPRPDVQPAKGGPSEMGSCTQCGKAIPRRHDDWCTDCVASGTREAVKGGPSEAAECPTCQGRGSIPTGPMCVPEGCACMWELCEDCDGTGATTHAE